MTTLRRPRQSKMLLLTGMAIVVHTALVIYSYTWNVQNVNAGTRALALGEARGNWQKDSAFRRWATRHGGVYVPVDDRTQPSPYLAHLPDRDVVTLDGRQLTLMNPAFMMSQMTSEFEDLYGVKGRITGLIQLNPANAPDAWERTVLERYETFGAKEVSEEQTIDGAPYLRLMRPMFMTQGCVKCHGHLGFKDGDLRGGVSVSVPLTHYLASADATITTIRATHALVWALGLLAITSFGFFIRRLLVRMEYAALHDHMTGLPNIQFFRQTLTQVIDRHKQHGDMPFAVCFIDLDRFKLLNDSCGHSFGDELLCKFARRVKGVLPPNSTFARMGGDEFLLLITGHESKPRAHACAQAIRESLRQPFEINELPISTNACIGICAASASHESANDIIRDADIAMYHAKRHGEGQIREFENSLHELAQTTLNLENDLRLALDNDQFEMYYQPIIDTQQKRIVGFESLIRWNHPRLGLVPPDRFITIAERSGQICEIGLWVLQQACTQATSWAEHTPDREPLFVAVNLSPIQLLDESVPEQVRKMLDGCGLRPEQLHLEVTESTLVEHTDRVRKCLSELRDIGILLSIDDFGTGYCSLSYLQEFEFDSLKIDKSFVRDLEGDSSGRNWKLVSTLTTLARSLKMKVIAEGVETPYQLKSILDIDSVQCQGYLFSKPVPANEIDALLANHSVLLALP